MGFVISKYPPYYFLDIKQIIFHYKKRFKPSRLNIFHKEQVTNDRVEVVDFEEPPSVKAARFLLSRGFSLANCTGMAIPPPVQADSIGILQEDPAGKPVTHLFGLIKRAPRRIWLGTIWFDSRVRGANEDSWAFETHGRQYAEQTKQLAQGMASAFKIKVTFRLVCEEADFETLRSDYFGL